MLWECEVRSGCGPLESITGPTGTFGLRNSAARLQSRRWQLCSVYIRPMTLRAGQLAEHGYLPNKTIFIIDDDAALLRSLERLLRAHGFRPLAFDSAQVFGASANPQDGLCLVLDINLNGSSGIEFRHQLAASGSLLPVIFITGNDSERVRKDAIDAGCVAYLSKPFPAQSLLDAIGNVATSSKSRPAARAACSRHRSK